MIPMTTAIKLNMLIIRRMVSYSNRQNDYLNTNTSSSSSSSKSNSNGHSLGVVIACRVSPLQKAQLVRRQAALVSVVADLMFSVLIATVTMTSPVIILTFNVTSTVAISCYYCRRCNYCYCFYYYPYLYSYCQNF